MSAGAARSLVLAGAICILWILIWRNAGAALREWQQPRSGKKTAHEIIPTDVVADIDSALTRTVNAATARYIPGAASPFRIAGEQPNPAPKQQASSPQGRHRLMLKGFLIKDRPLAILETSDGATHICGVGETVEGQKILRIGGERVVVKDPWGTYELSVRE
jgi:hypothetical protein